MKRTTLLSTIIYLVNIGVFSYLGWFCFYTYAIWVLPPRGTTREESIELLDERIVAIAQDLMLTTSIAATIMLILSWIALRKFKIQYRRRHLTILGIMAILIICAGLFLGMQDAKEGLTIEIDRNFVMK